MSSTTSLAEHQPTGSARERQAPEALVAAGRERLIADLDRRPPGRTRLELILFRDGDGLDPLLEAGDAFRAGVAGALLAAARAHGAGLYRLDGSAHALVCPDRGRRDSPAAAVRARVMEISEAIGSTMLHGDAALPRDAADGEAALGIALGRLRSRGRLASGSAERQIRDALMQVLVECRPGGAHVSVRSVAAEAVAVGRRLGMEIGELDVLVRAAELQDIGKLAIPDRILNKTEPLTEDEWDVIRRHPIVGERILGAAPALEPVARLVRSCSERFDGSGYPDGLKGAEIPIGARVIAVCVAFDAMTSARPYRAAMSVSEAVGELFRASGTQFDPAVVATFCATTGAFGGGAPDVR
jgi:two-component system cell cycle response regulator